MLTNERMLTMTLDIDFKPSFNNSNNEVFIDSYNIIQNQSKTHISNFISAKITNVRSGSTVVEYTVVATSFSDMEIQAVRSGVFRDISEIYTAIFDSKKELQNPTGMTQKKASIICGPPPKDLNFSTNFVAQWWLNKKMVLDDSLHESILDKEDGTATLNIKQFFVTDNGQYECRLIDGGKVFRQRKTIRRTTVAQVSADQGNSVITPVQELLSQSQFLNNNSLPGFLEILSNVTVNFTARVLNSTANIVAIIDILKNVANASSTIPITESSMKDILITAGVLTTAGARESWITLNGNTSVTRNSSTETERISSILLQSLETITSNLVNESFSIDTPSILLNKTRFTDSFNADFLNSSVEIVIPESDGAKSITVMTFASMNIVLPPRDEFKSSGLFINGRVVLVQSSRASTAINNISFTFDKLNKTLGNPQCVFWNFTLFDGLGGWDGEGCELKPNVNDTVTCTCDHLTSFSILMSPFVDCEECSIITFVGVGISIVSLVICLIIEAVIWRKIRNNTTSYLRHVSIVNIATSLLIADIWFIIGASIVNPSKDKNTCSAATFFIHFFYLDLFFWMLASALLLLYRTVSVFDGGLSKHAMLAIGFSLGYGAPIIISVITIAVTAPRNQYFQEDVCWLNADPSYALLAFVIPALMIVGINFIILVVVITKMLRRRAVGDAAQAAERNVLFVIVRSLAVLTPIFGLTWFLGIGTMVEPTNKGLHISFSFFNSLQGFFVLVFGLLLDRKVRSAIAIKSQTSGSGTRSTSAGNSSSGGFGFFRNWRRGRDGYQVSSGNSGVSSSFANS
ncbi:adhesion G-protein coupled receptor F1-like [Notolabrus celidotus]|uniref:adhesion G-protein coupled receptor F1-like n=1 Tax=Notolabrus celidotus TaxID=1203425 RepID=UPI00149031F1|nr:adhesion G-protein coupled receptor F1-like [Notolabrus celidotus]